MVIGPRLAISATEDRDPAEDKGRGDIDLSQPSAKAPDQRLGRVKDPFGQPAPLHDQAGHDKERHRDQKERVDRGRHGLGDHADRQAEPPQDRKRAQPQSDGKRDAQNRKDEEQDQKGEAHFSSP